MLHRSRGLVSIGAGGSGAAGADYAEPVRPTVGAALSPRPHSPAAGDSRAAASAGNGLNFVRLLLAATVLVSHSFLTTPAPDPTGGRLEALGDLAVNGFFVISGYLIAGSRLRTDFGRYLWRRFLRIFPAFWVVLIVTAFGFAPLYARLAGEHWVASSAVGYVGRNAALGIFQPGIADTLGSTAFGTEWNVPLWTLAYEFFAYLVVGVLLLVPVIRRHPRVVFPVLFVGLVAVQQLAYRALQFEHRMLVLYGLRLLSFFAVGVVAYFFRDRIRLHPLLGVGAGVATLLLHWLDEPNLLHLPWAYFLLWLGATLPVGLGRRNDISYGIYIYAFPMQLFVHLWLGSAGGWIGQSLLALVLTVPWAYASWRLVEQPALGLVRGRGSGARLRSGRVGRE